MSNPTLPSKLVSFSIFILCVFTTHAIANSTRSNANHAMVRNALGMAEEASRNRVFTSSVDTTFTQALEDAHQRGHFLTIYRLRVYRTSVGTGWVYKLTGARYRGGGKDIREALLAMREIERQGVVEQDDQPSGYQTVPGPPVFLLVEKGALEPRYRVVPITYLQEIAKREGLDKE